MLLWAISKWAWLASLCAGNRSMNFSSAAVPRLSCSSLGGLGICQVRESWKVASAIRSELTTAAQALILGGAVAFYLSDLFVARDRFVSEGITNRVIGLPLYYGGQYLLAFSVGFVA